MHYSMVKPPYSNLRVITIIFSGIQIFGTFTVDFSQEIEVRLFSVEVAKFGIVMSKLT